MNFLERIDLAMSALERRKDAQPSPDVAACDVCDENPGERTIFFAGTETWACEQCIEDHTPRRRLPRHRSNDEAAAYDAGVRARGEI
jgi:hypothetical protein